MKVFIIKVKDVTQYISKLNKSGEKWKIAFTNTIVSSKKWKTEKGVTECLNRYLADTKDTRKFEIAQKSETFDAEPILIVKEEHKVMIIKENKWVLWWETKWKNFKKDLDLYF